MFQACDLNCAEEGDVSLPQLEGGAGADVPVQRPLRDEGPVLRRFGLEVALKLKIRSFEYNLKSFNFTTHHD